MKASIWMIAAGLGLSACASDEGTAAGGADTGTTADAGGGDTAAGADVSGDVGGGSDAGATPVDVAGGDTGGVTDTTSPVDVPVADDTGGGGGADGGTLDAVTDAGGTDGGAVDAAVDAGGSTTTAGPCPLGERVGSIEVAHWDFYASVTGEVAEGVIPLTVLQLVKEEGGCKLLQKVNPFCDPPCGPGELCKHDGSCIPYPENQSVGTMTVDGLKVPVSMEPGPTKLYAETKVPFPMFDAGAPITITATGGDLPGFTLHGTGVEDLVLPDSVIAMVKGEPLTFSWEPPTVDTGAMMYISLNVDQHGNSPVTLKCEVPDNGNFQIPATLVKDLLEFGVSGFATLDLYRRTVDSVELAPGCVEATVFSFAPGKLTVDGHVPCFADKDCPEGETCNVPINTCVAP